MSGPIVRKYGFPNFEKIFGERALEHGVDEPVEATSATDEELKSKPERKRPANIKDPEPKKS